MSYHESVIQGVNSELDVFRELVAATENGLLALQDSLFSCATDAGFGQLID